MSVTTWADGYGVWHASVPQYAYARPADAARHAIRRELAEREAPNYDPRVTGVRLHEISDGRMIYRETTKH